MTYEQARDGKHYWLTPPSVYEKLDREFHFDFDPCPFPRPKNFDGLIAEWGLSNYVNPPFAGGITKWARKAISEHRQGKQVVMVFPIDKWIHSILAEVSEIRNLGDIHWLSTEDRLPGPGTGRHVMMFVLSGNERRFLQKRFDP